MYAAVLLAALLVGSALGNEIVGTFGNENGPNQRTEELENLVKGLVKKIEALELKVDNCVELSDEVDFEDRVKDLEAGQDKLFEALRLRMGDVGADDSQASPKNDSDLETRVEVLEFQMASVQTDVVEVKGEISNLYGQVTVLLQGQLTQDERILDLEGLTDGLVVSDFEIQSSLDELHSRVVELESANGTDGSVIEVVNQLNATVQELGSSVSSLDSAVLALQLKDQEIQTSIDELESRLNELESSEDTIAFHASFSTAVPTIPLNNPVVFDVVNVNIGDAYDPTSGVFVVPPGGAGVYYIFGHFENHGGEDTRITIQQNGYNMCRAHGDGDDGSEIAAFACGLVALLEEGDTVNVYLDDGQDDTPLYGYDGASAFSGFRIASQ